MLEDPAGIDYSSDTRPVLLRTARSSMDRWVVRRRSRLERVK
ncbi:MAG: hypothetical protein AW09_000736 [Candidatus Accumulibacter phosphatis]|jgi:hypothetical protein|uniref:Uncharacterized protein n=1 Tax=Candidatus Accumulibacter phosphatis TaxID=327160 RepID=A0A080MA27_9PROT|nr:MAG: hypothetical protein AW09_000736 [Candidatus Accumulibacter phosphatis]